MHVHLQDIITFDNFEEVLQNLSGVVRGVAISEQLQTRSNLAVVAATFLRSVALINERTIISNAVSLLLFCSYEKCLSPASCYLTLLFRQCRI